MPNNALRRQYAQGAGADMLANMQMEMGMAMEASTGCNKDIEADIREVQEYIGLAQERETNTAVQGVVKRWHIDSSSSSRVQGIGNGPDY